MRSQAGVNASGDTVHCKALNTAILDLNLADDHALLISPDRALYVADLPALAVAGEVVAGKAIALCLTQPYALITALLACDGHAHTMLLLAPDLPPATVVSLAEQAGIDLIISDRSDIEGAVSWPLKGEGRALAADTDTRWLLTTSGTTGMPKMVEHARASVTRGVRASDAARGARWAMFYDPTRFAGTQVLAQALLSGGTLLVPDANMSVTDAVAWLVEQGCTHASATPSLWRRILMAPAAGGLSLKQITLGGEIADGAILMALAARYPQTRITHIYASTETGVGFSVQDGKPGFPASWLEQPAGDIRIAVRDEMLWLRPPGGIAPRASHAEQDDEGYICTRDLVQRDGERVLFLGRDDASLNVGGVKVQVEAVEQVVHDHPDVAQCCITARPSPIMGNLLTLSVVPRDPATDSVALKREIKVWCKERLPRPAQPATIKIVAEIAMSASGKLERKA